MKEADVCEVACVEDEKVNRLKSMILSQNTSKVAEIFKALSDQTRAKIAYALTIEEELCVCDVANIVDASTATASHHLRLLKKQGLAKFRKKGKLVYYSLDDHHVKELIEIALTHQMELEERDR
ncbi:MULTISPECIES: ArsR/SmtB family transcription factor [Rossellomorea]|jgi:ArsR family transcriptional regulator, lead/cadmium/zinc/bismuth-responsive transcriptional repressor|uniref:ArsR/SmtB family transcription factor n=1 Tax=Rossellomorea TaxID=2837508 RepID=UPI002494F2FC|nr:MULTISPECIES: metalloregulator ArsR/SmtB family transcription factor [Rossellomorea]MDT9023399.1 metalloregulator ArsR/SmtB family transcription factor [Rossellomorea sp. YC4-1]